MSGSLEPGYFAVPHPHESRMTYWRVTPNVAQGARSWPPKTNYSGLGPAPEDAADLAAWTEAIIAFSDYIDGTIWAEPDRCRARFAALTTRCGICGRRLTSARSKVEGIGPECRRDFTDEQIAAHAARLAVAYAERLP